MLRTKSAVKESTVSNTNTSAPTSWVKGKIASVKKATLKRRAPANALSLSTTPQPLKTEIIVRTYQNPTGTGAVPLPINPPTFVTRQTPPATFDQVLLAEVEKHRKVLQDKAARDGIDCQIIIEDISTHFYPIVVDPPAEVCSCPEDSPKYRHIELFGLVLTTIPRVMPELPKALGSDFKIQFPACCPTRYIHELKLRIAERLLPQIVVPDTPASSSVVPQSETV